MIKLLVILNKTKFGDDDRNGMEFIIPALNIRFIDKEYLVTGVPEEELQWTTWAMCIGHIRQTHKWNEALIVPNDTDEPIKDLDSWKHIYIDVEDEPSPQDLFLEYQNRSTMYVWADPRSECPLLVGELRKDVSTTMMGQVKKEMSDPVIKAGTTVRVTLMSSMGDFGFQTDLSRSTGYIHRGQELSDFDNLRGEV